MPAIVQDARCCEQRSLPHSMGRSMLSWAVSLPQSAGGKRAGCVPRRSEARVNDTHRCDTDVAIGAEALRRHAHPTCNNLRPSASVQCLHEPRCDAAECTAAIRLADLRPASGGAASQGLRRPRQQVAPNALTC